MQFIELSRTNGIEILGISDPLFPSRYREIPDAPVVIHVKGNVHALNVEKTLAIVGTREPTEFGIKAGERLSSIFAKHQFVVVSGLAVGCDAVAHLGCLNAGGITVAIMACGLDNIYPSENRQWLTEFWILTDAGFPSILSECHLEIIRLSTEIGYKAG